MLRTRARRRAKGAADRRVRSARPSSGSPRPRDRAGVEARLARLAVHPVLTAHPTEARRRTLLVALRRIRRLLDPLDDPLTTPDEDADLRRRLREEITLLWHTGDLRAVAPTPLDEVRSALAIFDETLFVVVPRSIAGVDRALDGRGRRSGAPPTTRTPARPSTPARTGTRPRASRRSLRFGSWIGADRDGHPGVTAEITLHARAAPGRPPAPRLRGGRAAADADGRRAGRARARSTGRSTTRSRATRRSSPRPSASSGAASPRSPTGSGSARSRSGIRRTRAAMTGEAGARDAAATPTPRRSTRSSRAPAGAGRRRPRPRSPGARSPSCAGSSRRSGSTSRRSRSASTRRSTGRRSRRSGRGAGPDREVAAGVTAGRGPGDVPGDRAPPGEVRRRGVPPVRDLVHDRPDDVAAVLELARRAAEPEPFGRPVAAARRPAARRCPSSTSSPARERRRPGGRRRAPRRPARATRATAPTSGTAATPRR